MLAERICGQRGVALQGWFVRPISALALFGLSIAGCGINVAPQPSSQTDSSAPPASAAPAAVAMTPAPPGGAPMMPMTSPDSSSGGAAYAGGAGYPGGPGGYNPNSSQQSEEAMRQQAAAGGYGGGAAGQSEGAAAGVDPAQMEAAMRAQQAREGGGAAAGLSPQEMEAAMRAQQNFGQNGEGAAASPEEMARRQRENAQGGAAAGNAPGGAIPGAGGQYGGRGGDAGLGGSFKEDDAEYVVIKFADAVQADDYESAGKLVADKATGLLASVRKGDISDNQKQQLKAYVTGLKHIGTRPQGRSKTANFNGGSNKVLSFKIEKISDEFVISDLDIHDAPRKRAGR